MNGGEGGMSTLDRAVLIVTGAGFLLLYAGRHLRRNRA